MTWGTQAAKIQRTPLVLVEVDLDYYDDVSITATNGDGSLCYRTPETTDQGTFTVVAKTRRYQSRECRPLANLGAIPCLMSVSTQDEELQIGKGLGHFGKVTVTLQDFVDDDRIEDPFYSHASRASITHTSGTYFRKLIARNPYWVGRELRLLEGWENADGTWHAADAITRTYVIRDIQGPTAGRVTITAVGPLQLLGLNNIQVPEATSGKLLAAIDADDTTATIDPEYAASSYGTSGYVRVDDEIIGYTRSGTTLSLTRAQWDTEADSHSAGNSIQECVAYSDEYTTDIIYDLLTTYGGVDSSYCNKTAWDDERDTWLSLYKHTVIFSEPEKILDIVKDLLEITASYAWWNDQSGVIEIKALRPAVSNEATWTDQSTLTSDPVIKRDMRDRVSRTDILIGIRQWTADTGENRSYRVRVVGHSAGNGETEHKTDQIQVTRCRYLTVDQINLASRAAYQTTETLKDGRQEVELQVSAKDATIQIGDVILLQTRDIVDRNGDQEDTRILITRRHANRIGSQYVYRGEILPFSGRYAFMTDIVDGSSDWPDYDDATTDQRDPGAYMTNAAGTIPDPPYLMG